MANSLWTLRKRLNSLITSLQGSVLLLITTVNFLRFLLIKRASHFQQLSFRPFDILKIIRILNPNKAHGQDMISIRMFKTCDESICKPLGTIFWSCLQNGKFSSERKKSNVVHVSGKTISKS